MKKIRLLLIEDNRLLREGLLNILKKQKDIKLLNGNKAEITVVDIHQLKPNIILLDLGLRNQNSLKIVSVAKKEFPKAKIIVMDLAPVQSDILQFVQSGASGFILKDARVDDLLSIIHAVAEGKTILPPVITESLFSQTIEHAIKGGRIKIKNALKMTRREHEIIALVSDGISNKAIGESLGISAHTVKSHLHNIMEKLALHTRLELANYYYDKNYYPTINSPLKKTAHKKLIPKV